VSVVAGQKVRVALAWSSHTSGSSNLGKSDVLTADLDLVVRQPNGTTVGSFSFDNSYEAVDLTASSTGTMRIEIRQERFDASSEPYGLAWALTSPFSDVGNSIFYDDILWMVGAGITGGCGSGRFCPTSPVTREQMASFIARALDLPATSTDFFTDDENSIHENDINRLAAAGITGGCASGERRFCPGLTLKRGPMASFLARAFDLPATANDYFTDDSSSMHEDNINRLAAAGITGGCTATQYCPSSVVTREQMAAFLHRAL
jgi:hypothetical protein